MGNSQVKWDAETPPLEEVGAIGFMVYMPLFLFLSWRLYLSVKEQISPAKKRNRMLFHFCMFLYAFLEMITSSILWNTNTATFAETVIHFVAMYFNIVGFSIVFYSITKIIFRLDFNEQFTVYWVIAKFLFLIFIADMAYMFVFGIQGTECKTRNCNNVLMFRDCVEGLCVFLLSLNFSITGYRISQRLFMTQTGFNWTLYLKPTNEMLKINIITVACTLFYLLRVFFIVTIVVYESKAENMEKITNFYGVLMSNNLYWFLVTKWITFIIPTILLLYLMRPKNRMVLKEPNVGGSFQGQDNPTNTIIYNSGMHKNSSPGSKIDEGGGVSEYPTNDNESATVVESSNESRSSEIGTSVDSDEEDFVKEHDKEHQMSSKNWILSRLSVKPIDRSQSNDSDGSGAVS